MPDVSTVRRTTLPDVTQATCSDPNGLIGRYVSVQIVNGMTDSLILCEVRVMGSQVVPCTGNACPGSG